MAKYRCAIGDVPILGERDMARMESEAAELTRSRGGERHGMIPRDWTRTPLGSFCAPFKLPTIPRDQWKERIADLVKYKARLSDLIAYHKLTVKNQGQTPLCWTFGITYAYETALLQRHRTKVRLSPASVGQLIQGVNGMAGGYGPEAIKKIGEAGIVPSSMWPDSKYGRQYDNAETKAARKKYLMTEWLDLATRNFDQVMTCLLMLFPLGGGFNWWRHLVMLCDPVDLGRDEYGILIGNSWGPSYGENGFAVLQGSKCIPDTANAPNVGLMQL